MNECMNHRHVSATRQLIGHLQGDENRNTIVPISIHS